MSHLLYAYIAKPTKAQVGSFLLSLQGRGVSISHFGKSDPPPRFGGSVDEAVSTVFSGTDFTTHTFARDAARRLHFGLQIQRDPRWTHSTVSASCPDTSVLTLVAESAAAAFDLFIAIRGVSGGGKKQPWQVVHPPSEKCPDELRSTFVAA
jgi:hypothetical protein